MQQVFTLETEAGLVSAELARRGVATGTKVHVEVTVTAEQQGETAMAAIAQDGGAFEWLAVEPDLYTDADLIERAS